MTAATLPARSFPVSPATAIAAASVLVDLGLLVVLFALEAAARSRGFTGEGTTSALIMSTAVVVGAGVGATIVARLPRNPVGWLVLGTMLLFVGSDVLDVYGRYNLRLERRSGSAAAAAALDEVLWLLVFGALAALLQLYPTGRPRAGRLWSGLAKVGLPLFPLAAAVLLFAGHQQLEAPWRGVHNPFAVRALAGPLSEGLGFVLILSCGVVLLGSAASVIARYRSAERAQRYQLKWVVVAAGALPVTLFACLGLALVAPSVSDVAGSVGFAVVLVTIPVAMALALGRYRLYSVDRVVDTALLHLALSLLLVGVYAGVVVLSGRLVADGGRRSPVTISAATLAVAALAAPLRRRLMVVLRRQLHRRTYDAVHIVDDFVARLRDERATLSELEPTLARALADPGLQLGWWQAATRRYVTMDGSEVGRAGPGRAVYPVTRDGAPVALLVHDEALLDEPLLLETVARAAALPLDNGRLHLEVLARLEEVRASRQRIVAAAYEERRRIERDLHDGAQQRLVSLALSLRLARAELGGDAATLLDDAANQLSAAVEEVRELARGIHPAALSEDGLAGALESLADRTPLPILLDVEEVDVPDDVAAAAYFTACEAVTNVVKHAAAHCIWISCSLADGTLMLEVRDDGAGGAQQRVGGGLQGLTDRLDALGGRLTVVSRPGRGTTVRAELPCAS